jgi:hypothetical protein
MEAQKCKFCGERGWNHVCPTLTRGGGESRRPAVVGRAAAQSAQSPATLNTGGAASAGVASGPREAKRGRPRLEDRGKPKPWETAGMSRASWYRRKAEKAK